MSGAQALLRFSRDRRGYEHFYLVEPDRQGKGQERILYWFRSPPGVRVGRVPFDDELKRMIEAQNSGLSFDWPRLLATPIPPPAAEVERWRERRQVERAEKAARAARRADLEEGEPEEPPPLEVEADKEPDTGQTPPNPAKRRRRRRRRGRGRHGQTAAPSGEQAPPTSNPDSSND
jgi:hypothetical protein